jgi:FtsP/CotA-like multicopper oxidase with cupredoxin domain
LKFGIFILFVSSAIAPFCSAAKPVEPCPRFASGSVIQEPEDLYSKHGLLEVSFSYQTRVDESGNTLYCFINQDGEQSPTLHVHPGDRLVIHLKNDLTSNSTMPSMQAMPQMTVMGSASNACGAMMMTPSSVNIHYHGTNVPPVCHQDEVIKTMVNVGESFDYDVHFPNDEPPGLYWYHPHIHGVSEPAVLGGASGAIIVDGLENVNPAVAGLPQKLLVIRDNLVPGNPTPGGDVPSWDVSVNYAPVAYPTFTPAKIQARHNEKQFWRLLNASADTILDVELSYDGVAQPLEVVGLDGVPTGSQDGTSRGKSISLRHILIPPAGRAEFIVTAPSPLVHSALFQTRNIDTGPDGDNDPARPLVAIETSTSVQQTEVTMPLVSARPPSARFAGLAECKPSAQRKLYFSEILSDPTNPNSPTNFFITVDGQTPVLFDPNNPPAIVTRQGAVEDWVIENRALENHEFHIHQIHFLLMEQNGVRVANPQFLDTVQIPYWNGIGPYPSVKLRMDFRGPTVGDFVYHCHILGHEDGGMMAIIHVKPAEGK